MARLFSPTDYEIVGTLEKLSGRANINEVLGKNPDGTYNLDYEGYTEVFWDDQKTVKRLNEDTDKIERIFLDEMGDEWFESQLHTHENEEADD